MAESSLYLWNSPNSLSGRSRSTDAAVRRYAAPSGSRKPAGWRSCGPVCPTATAFRSARRRTTRPLRRRAAAGFAAGMWVSAVSWSGPAAAGSVREQGKSTTFCRMPAFFLIFPICLTPQRHITRRKPKRRDAPDSGSDFRAKNLLFTVQGTKNRRHTEQNGQKKESPATESPEIRAEIRRREARHRMRPEP